MTFPHEMSSTRDEEYEDPLPIPRIRHPGRQRPGEVVRRATTDGDRRRANGPKVERCGGGHLVRLRREGTEDDGYVVPSSASLMPLLETLAAIRIWGRENQETLSEKAHHSSCSSHHVASLIMQFPPRLHQ